MEIATSIYLRLMSGINFSLVQSDYWVFSLVHAACKLQSVVVRITASLFIKNKVNKLLYYNAPHIAHLNISHTERELPPPPNKI